MLNPLPFSTFGEAAAFDLEVRVSCYCRRCVVIDGTAEAFRNRLIMGARFCCTTILAHGQPCRSAPSIYIGKRGRWEMTLGEHSRAIRARQATAPIVVLPRTYGEIVQRGEVAMFYCDRCVPSYTICHVEFDEPPWDRFLASPVARFQCPGCRKGLRMHLHHGPGTPATERFLEASEWHKVH
jgi:hypothetical protein